MLNVFYANILKIFSSFFPKIKETSWCDQDTQLHVDQLHQLSKLIKYRFNNLNFLKQSITHSSLAHENCLEDNERLEFLGDSILGAVISHYLFTLYSGYDEGKLTKIKSRLVSRTTLLRLAKKMDLGKYILLGKGEEKCLGREKGSTLTNALESVIGAVFLDGGFESAQKVILNLWKEEISKDAHIENYKGQLQEYSQKKFQCKPVYQVIATEGPDHNKIFSVQVKINNIVTIGRSSTKSWSEQLAAFNALKELGLIDQQMDGQ